MNLSERETILAAYVHQHLSPTDDERKRIGARYDELKGFLDGRTLQNGSYARFTSTTPVNDLDVIYVLPEEVLKSIRTAQKVIDPKKLDITQILKSLARQLRDLYGEEARVEVQPHSVGVYFGTTTDFSIDVVPAQPLGEMFLVPEAAHVSVGKRRAMYRTGALSAAHPNWKKSHPKAYIAQATELDERTGGRFRKSAKAMKKWRWKCKCADETLRLKSFHLEQAVARYFLNNPTSTCSAAIASFVNELPALIDRPQFPDLADDQCYIDDYIKDLTPEERTLILTCAADAKKLWLGVEQAGTDEETTLALDAFFGIETPQGLSASAALPGGDGLSRALKRGLFADYGRDPGEEFLSDLGIPAALSHSLRINADVTQDGFRTFRLLGHRSRLKHQKRLEFYIEDCSVPKPFDVKWKVKNTGEEAIRRGQLRGEILSNSGLKRREKTDFFGDHYVQCYVIKDGVCVAAAHISVDIDSN